MKKTKKGGQRLLVFIGLLLRFFKMLPPLSGPAVAWGSLDPLVSCFPSPGSPVALQHAGPLRLPPSTIDLHSLVIYY